MIEQYATPILIASIALNALWLAGASLALRSSRRKWFWRSLSLLAAALAVIWAIRFTGSTPAPTHTLRLPLLTLNLDLAAIAWHTLIIPLAMLAMLLRGAVVRIKRTRSSTVSPNSEMGGREPA